MSVSLSIFLKLFISKNSAARETPIKPKIPPEAPTLTSCKSVILVYKSSDRNVIVSVV